MSADDFDRHTDLKMLLHHIYEFQKGVRRLVLCTICPTCARLMAERLQARRIDYLVQPVTADKVNLYFGHRACLDAVRMFVHKPLNELSAEEDFMLGVMLGYATFRCSASAIVPANGARFLPSGPEADRNSCHRRAGRRSDLRPRFVSAGRGQCEALFGSVPSQSSTSARHAVR